MNTDSSFNSRQRNTRTFRAQRLSAAVIVAGLAFSACGDDAPEAVSSTTVAEAASSATSAPTSDTVADAGDEMMGASGAGCAAVPADGEGSFAGMADDPAATAASNNPVLSTLVTAVKAAGLVDTLNSDGPFTIFAPTNDAFAAIPAEILDAVLADTDLLTAVLTYHVIPGESLTSDKLPASAATVEGGELSFAGATVNAANIVCMDVPVANGTVHIIDSVLLPQVALDAITAMTTADTTADSSADAMLGASGPACAAVPADGEGSFAGMADDPAATAASNNPVLSTLVTAVQAAGLVDTLNSDGPFTIFAPTNDAFAAIPPADLTAVLADTDLLTSILTFHVVAGESLDAAGLIEAGKVTTVAGGELTIAAAGDEFTVNGANAVCINVPTANATVHIIDAVLMP